MMRFVFLRLLAAVLLPAATSCVALRDPAQVEIVDRGIERGVTDQLVSLPGAGERARPEAARIAREAVRSSREQAGRYRVAFRGWLHNSMVNTGLKDRGLCWHWMEDLYPRLRALETRHFQIVCGVRDSGTPREHHCVVAVPAGRPFEDGLVLDPWVGGGTLEAFPVRGAKRKWRYDPAWTEPLERYYKAGYHLRRPPPA